MIFEKDISHLEETKSFSVKMRYLYWQMAVDMIRDGPFTGRGVGQFREDYYPYLNKYLLLGMNGRIKRFAIMQTDSPYI